MTTFGTSPAHTIPAKPPRPQQGSSTGFREPSNFLFPVSFISQTNKPQISIQEGASHTVHLKLLTETTYNHGTVLA